MSRDRIQRLISTERLRPPERAANTPSVRRGTGPLIRKAYCKVDAGSGSSIVCYLDTDATGAEITVHCPIAGGTALNEAFPRLLNGTLVTVWYDNGTWRAIMTFQDADEDCE